MMDIVFCIVPKLDPYAPTTGPALLKAHCVDAGFKAMVKDFNIDLYNWLKLQNRHEEFFNAKDTGFITWYDRDYVYPPEWEELYEIISPRVQLWIDELIELKTKWVGLSMLSSASVCVGKRICELLREQAPEIKIVIGGAAVRSQTKSWVDNGLVDYYIFGDGEFSIVELLNGNYAADGINSNSPCQVDDLNTTLMPDYDDIDWKQYEYVSGPFTLAQDMAPIYITGSRGCVKRCTFCDVPMLWPKYKWRSADHIFGEIQLMYEKHNRRLFRFTDSLINGSMSQFRSFLTKIKEFNDEKDDIDQITWWSQWIIRARGQMLEEDFKLMADSGITELDIGLESFSESVRWHMGKKFTDDDLWWNLEMMHKYDIHYTLLMITGYPTETAEDHQITLDGVKKMAELGYVSSAKNKNRPSTAYLSFGNTMMLQPDYKIYKMLENDPEFKDGIRSVDWSYKDNLPEERIRRHLEVNTLVSEITNQNWSWLQEKQLRQDLEEIRKHRDAYG
tara:strand:- start:5703 stop:7214 length:1512 start_codon:yes stop_codon:yes gene_type:complete